MVATSEFEDYREGRPRIIAKHINAHDDDTNNFINERTKILEESTLESELNAERYLLIINAGGILAVATISKSTDLLPPSIFVSVSFALFFIAIICIGLLKAVRVINNYKKKGNWEKDIQLYYQANMDYETLLTRYHYRFRKEKLLQNLAWFIFLLYIIAVCLIGFEVTKQSYAAIEKRSPDLLNDLKIKSSASDERKTSVYKNLLSAANEYIEVLERKIQSQEPN
jgi:hypothetical protein